MIVAFPISIPHTHVIVYGIELTGDTPRLDLTDNAIPIVIINSPTKYIGILAFMFLIF